MNGSDLWNPDHQGSLRDYLRLHRWTYNVFERLNKGGDMTLNENHPMFGKLSTAEAAQFLGLSKHHLYNLLSANEGPAHFKYHGRLFFDVKDLEAFRKSNIKRHAS